MWKNNITLSILITTMNDWIHRVKKELLPQLKEVDEVIISHQITDKNIIPEKDILWENVKYYFMNEKWLSKNRNNALKFATWDICHICDDDLNYIPWFVDIIKWEYLNKDSDIITFQAENEQWKKHFWVNEWTHNRLSVLKVWSWWITFKKKALLEKNINFDDNFGLGTKCPVWEENIFLTDCIKKWLKMYHCDNPIVIHPNESSGIDYREELIVARIKVFKRLFWYIWWFLGVFYFTIFHYRYYKDNFSIFEFLNLSFKSLFNVK